MATPADGARRGLSRTRSILELSAPTRALKSFDNLVALANDQETLRQTARKLVWRDRGEPVTQLNDLEACLKHAALGGARKSARVVRASCSVAHPVLTGAGSLAFGIRSGVNLFLLLFRVFKSPKSVLLPTLRRLCNTDNCEQEPPLCYRATCPSWGRLV